MFYLYSFLYTIAFILMLPVLYFRREKYASGFKQRFGFLPDFIKDARPVIWIHCVSVGETNAARPLINKILEKYPNYRLVVSTTTKTGQEMAKSLFAADADLIFYFPFDWCFTVRRVLRVIRPSMVLIMETEIWLNFFRETHRSGARVFIINGRLSEKSVQRYAWIKKTMKRTLRCVDAAFMQTRKDAKRLVELGINIKKVRVTGNFKFDQKRDEKEKHLTAYFKERFDFSKESPLIIAASTHEPEEKWILDSFKKIYQSDVENLPRLMLVPRHPERFREVEDLIKKTGFSWAKRTGSFGLEDGLAEIILLDSIGELRTVYPLSEIVFVGGSLIPHGGQNILEPALEKKAIVTGAYMSNFEAMAKEFAERKAFIQLPELEEDQIADKLAETFIKLLKNKKLVKRLSNNAYVLMNRSRGATDKTVEYLKPYLQVQSNFADRVVRAETQK
jgi:3-deoxy-D-manno-octulosonic-acid transferase